MVIDLDKCTACGACVAACKVENNVPSSTPGEASEDRSMFWMEIIRFVPEEESSPGRIRYVPRPCFHCDNPPCTKVCPVRATYRTEEGFVAQIYDRCIGCRYCTAACPYTVKIFNWFEPQTWNEERAQALNPDVSLRPTGVVEKCTFCHHRYQVAKEQAKLAGRPLHEEDYTVACQDACPAQAIYFGDLDDETTQVHQQSRSTRAWRMMEDIGTEPKVYYLATGE
jgi:molybdopterin-containing oxidoreductase family iron-sulfur binding subunit